MSAVDILSRLTADGITLTVDGTRLLASPAAAITDAHRNLIRENKPALHTLLVEPRRLWAITEADGTGWTSSFTPMHTMGEVLSRKNPIRGRCDSDSCDSCDTWGENGGTVAGVASVAVANPRNEKSGTPAQTLSAQDKALVTAALDHLGEDDPEARREVLARCATDPEALAFWTSSDRMPDPRQALYCRWLEGITEGRALMTLDTAQVQQALAAGVVSRATARGNVLLVVRSPAGDLGPGAVGMLAIPREKYRDFSPTAALEALATVH